MELKQLEYFITVGNLKNLSKASKVLFVSQPALSKSVSGLEKELGVQLFERRNRKMSLTNYGQVFFNRVSRILKELDSTVSAIRQMSGQINSVIVIASVMPEFFTPVSIAYHHRNPDVILQDYGNNTLSAKEALIYGDISFCLTPVAFDHPSLVWFSLKEEEMLLIAPNNMDIPSENGRVQLKDLASAPFISTLSGTNLHQCTTSFCKSAGFNPNIVIETPSIDTISMLVSENCGVAFISETLHENLSKPRMDPNRPPYQVLHVEQPPCLRNVGIAMQRDHVLSSIEFDFLKHLLFFFQPRLAQDEALCENNIFYRYLLSHYHREINDDTQKDIS